MKERPILMSAPMVRALLEGRKTQTRRKVRTQPCVIDGVFMHHVSGSKWESGRPYRCPYGKVGDRLWVRETCWINQDERIASYRADGEMPDHMRGEKWTPSIFMPHWASRITLEITGIRVQRLQEISIADALAEGITHSTLNDPRVEYQWLWEAINGPGSWNENPYIWCLTFRRI